MTGKILEISVRLSCGMKIVFAWTVNVYVQYFEISELSFMHITHSHRYHCHHLNQSFTTSTTTHGDKVIE